MKVKIIGGGLAGSEAAYQLLKRGVDVELYEMRPKTTTPCHKTEHLAELVCSNSLKSTEKSTASGVLKTELAMLDSMILDCAYLAQVPSGQALAVDREIFSVMVEARLKSYDNFKLIREEVVDTCENDLTVIASGPLTSDKLASEIKQKFGSEDLYFYDAVAPIVSGDSINYEKAYFASRYNKGDGADYLNCPLTKDEYLDFYKELIAAKTVELKEFEKIEVFEGCMPVEIMAKRGVDTIRFGMMKPVGLSDDRYPDKKFYAVVQLRKEDAAGSMYNLVGFQTNLTFSEQKRVFALIPGLENAEFLRYGVMHRNTYINSPKILNTDFSVKGSDKTFFAGQITGVEGYLESAASGLVAGINVWARTIGASSVVPSEHTMIGALCRHIGSNCKTSFQPMNANLGLLPVLDEKITDKRIKKEGLALRSERAMQEYVDKISKLS